MLDKILFAMWFASAVGALVVIGIIIGVTKPWKHFETSGSGALEVVQEQGVSRAIHEGSGYGCRGPIYIEDGQPCCCDGWRDD